MKILKEKPTSRPSCVKFDKDFFIKTSSNPKMKLIREKILKEQLELERRILDSQVETSRDDITSIGKNGLTEEAKNNTDSKQKSLKKV